jgi:hypothetical protein
MKDLGNNKKSETEYFLTKKGRSFMRSERVMKTLSEEERKAYEECMALLQGITERGGIEEACDWLETYASEQDEKTVD